VYTLQTRFAAGYSTVAQVHPSLFTVIVMPSAGGKTDSLNFITDAMQTVASNFASHFGPGFVPLGTTCTIQGAKQAIQANHGVLNIAPDEFMAAIGEHLLKSQSEAERAEWTTLMGGGSMAHTLLATKPGSRYKTSSVCGTSTIQVGLCVTQVNCGLRTVMITDIKVPKGHDRVDARHQRWLHPSLSVDVNSCTGSTTTPNDHKLQLR
jgi:hypothetical protein